MVAMGLNRFISYEPADSMVFGAAINAACIPAFILLDDLRLRLVAGTAESIGGDKSPVAWG